MADALGPGDRCLSLKEMIPPVDHKRRSNQSHRQHSCLGGDQCPSDFILFYFFLQAGGQSPSGRRPESRGLSLREMIPLVGQGRGSNHSCGQQNCFGCDQGPEEEKKKERKEGGR